MLNKNLVQTKLNWNAILKGKLNSFSQSGFSLFFGVKHERIFSEFSNVTDMVFVKEKD